MSELDPKELKKKIDDYFTNVSKEQLRKDLIEAGWEIYQNCYESPFEIAEIVNRHYWELL